TAGATPPTLVMAPHATGASVASSPSVGSSPSVTATRQGSDLMLRDGQLRVAVDRASGTLAIFTADAQRPSLRMPGFASLARGTLVLRFAKGTPLYGVGGTDAFDRKPARLLLHGRETAKAGAQGNAGAPFVWSTAGFGVLMDSNGARFDVTPGSLRVSRLSRPDADLYLIVGQPQAIFGAVADLSGHAPLFPKWSLGFINSQWGIDEKELREIVGTY